MIVPAALLPSPQEIVAEKSPTVAAGLASVKLATTPLNEPPSTELIEPAVADNTASPTTALLLALTAEPPASVICTLMG